MTDLIIIGSGPGGYRAAAYAARKGLSVIIVESDKAGGTCLNAGCIPTKCLAHDAGIKDSDFTSAYERKELVTTHLRQGVEQILSQPGITFIHGEAKFKDAHTIIVNGNEFEAENIIIATGSVAKLPPVPGIDNKRVITSDEALKLTSLPTEIVIIGAGVIGMEFASVFARFGTKVTVIEYLKECLPMLDKDIAKRLRKSIEKQGVTFHMDSAVKEITETEVVFTANKNGTETRLDCHDAPILMATGRKPRLDTLDLDAAGVAYTSKGIVTDENMRTSQSNIFAIGDVTGKQMLAHAATFMGFRAVNTILGISDTIRLDIMPSAIFTYPEAATVGINEDQCKALGKECKCYKGYYRSNGKALAENEPEGMVKIIADEDNHIIGCTAYGAHAADIVQETTAFINRNSTISDIACTIHIHPTVSEILQDACWGKDNSTK